MRTISAPPCADLAPAVDGAGCSAVDGPEAFPDLPAALVSGRHLTWYGPSLVEAREVLERQLGQAFSATTSR